MSLNRIFQTERPYPNSISEVSSMNPIEPTQQNPEFGRVEAFRTQAQAGLQHQGWRGFGVFASLRDFVLLMSLALLSSQVAQAAPQLQISTARTCLFRFTQIRAASVPREVSNHIS